MIAALDFDKLNVPINRIASPTFCAFNCIHKLAVHVTQDSAFAVNVDADMSAFPLNPSVRLIFEGFLYVRSIGKCGNFRHISILLWVQRAAFLPFSSGQVSEFCSDGDFILTVVYGWHVRAAKHNIITAH